MDHQIYTKGIGWRHEYPEPHPTLWVKITSGKEEQEDLQIHKPNKRLKETETLALPDTGAQICVMGMNLTHAMGLTRKELFPVSLPVSTANNENL